MKKLIVLGSVIICGLSVQAQYKMPKTGLVEALKSAIDTTRIVDNKCNITTQALNDIEFYRKAALRLEIQTLVLLNILKENNDCLKLDHALNQPSELVKKIIAQENQSKAAISVINEYVSSASRVVSSLSAALKAASEATRIDANKCNLDLQTVSQIEMVRTSGLPIKVQYVSLKGLLSEANECLQLDLLNGEHSELVRVLLNYENRSEKAIDIINQFLAQ